MIPLEADPSTASLIIGHNVAFDRTYIKEQYRFEVRGKNRFSIERKHFCLCFQSSGMRFLDTMSLHIMCSGFTHAQRMQYQAFEKGSAGKEEISAEDDLDEQHLSMILASEKEKDFKAYAKMRQMTVSSST